MVFLKKLGLEMFFVPKTYYCILLNSVQSSLFPLYHGTRQGCSLSPLLFAVAKEPLATMLRQTPEVLGFYRDMHEEKVAYYADNILIFLSDTYTSLSSASSLITEFGMFSGFRINWDKSVLLLLDPLPDLYFSILPQFKIVSQFKYLGVQNTSHIQDYIPLNLNPLLIIFHSHCSV